MLRTNREPDQWRWTCELRCVSLCIARTFSIPMINTGSMNAQLSRRKKASVGFISGMQNPNMTIKAVYP